MKSGCSGALKLNRLGLSCKANNCSDAGTGDLHGYPLVMPAQPVPGECRVKYMYKVPSSCIAEDQGEVYTLNSEVKRRWLHWVAHELVNASECPIQPLSAPMVYKNAVRPRQSRSPMHVFLMTHEIQLLHSSLCAVSQHFSLPSAFHTMHFTNPFGL